MKTILDFIVYTRVGGIPLQVVMDNGVVDHAICQLKYHILQKNGITANCY